jgi:rhodanese-related sulfurtransferase
VAREDDLAFLTAKDLRALVERRAEDNVYVLDVRTADEFAGGHVAGATWAPGGQAVQATDEYVAVRAAWIVLVCDDTSRSIITASWLARMGYPRVAVLQGGLAAWREAGGAIETGHPRPEPFGLDEARRRIASTAPGPLDDALVLSVDPSDVYARGHVAGAVWVCRSRLEQRIGSLAPDRARPVLVTCADGRASALAAAALAGLGYHARVLDGGLRAWEAAGAPVERGATRLADEPDDVVLKPYDRGRAAMEAYLRWEEDLDDEGHSPHPLLS